MKGYGNPFVSLDTGMPHTKLQDWHMHIEYFEDSIDC